MLWKCCSQYASKFGKLSSGHRTGKCQLSFQSQRKAMPNKLDLEKAEEKEIKQPTSVGSWKKQENSKNKCSLLHWLRQSLWLCGSQQTVANSERDGNPDHLACLLWNLYISQEATVRTLHGTMDWLKIGKRLCQGCIWSSCSFKFYAKCVCAQSCLTLCDPMDCSPPSSSVYGISWQNTGNTMSSFRASSWPRDQTSISHISCIAGGFFTAEPPGKSQTTSFEMPGWMNYKLKSRLLGEISTTSDRQKIPP